MSDSERDHFLDEQIALLVGHFGVDRVRASVDRTSGGPRRGEGAPTRRASHLTNSPRESLTAVLNGLKQSDPEKHRLLSDFVARLKRKEVLPDAEDIRRFAQTIGQKSIQGRSRRELVNELTSLLVESSLDQLRVVLPAAETISADHRQRGFAVLTDKLLREQIRSPKSE
jgi:hypothetical protein